MALVIVVLAAWFLTGLVFVACYNVAKALVIREIEPAPAPHGDGPDPDPDATP